MPEGTVEVDNGGAIPMDDEVVTGAGASDDDAGAGDDGDDNGGAGNGSQDDDGKGAGKTDKGTNLDPDPLTRANQLRANAEAMVKRYERVLASPELLREFAKKAGYSLAEAKEALNDAKDKSEEVAFKPDRFKTKDDLASAFNELAGGYKKEISDLKKELEDLRKGFTGFQANDRVRQVATTMSADISSVQKEYPQLNPSSPEYDPELEKRITAFYAKLDAVDPDDLQKGFKGNISLAWVAEQFMGVAAGARKNGADSAKTQVIVKKAGRIVDTGKGGSSGKGESSNPGTSIALKIAQEMGGRK